MEVLFQHLKQALDAGVAGNVSSLLIALVLAYLGGILSSFTPCIYPMIPITMGYIGGTAERSWKNGLVLSSFYVLGMASIYAALGMIAALSGRIFGSMTNTTGWHLTLGAIMVVSSLWMLDVIKFDPNVWFESLKRRRKRKSASAAPASPHSQKGSEASEASVIGAFVLGASSGFIAAPCTTPVLTTILSYIATQNSVAFGTLLMFCFALGLGTILVFVGTFAGAVKVLPRSGGWLQRIKIISGLLILALGEYFIYKAGTLK